MNNYDEMALACIKGYRRKYGKYPPRVEATAGFRSAMTREYLTITEPPEETHIPVRPLGSGDIIYKRLALVEMGDSQDKADNVLDEKSRQLRANLMEAGFTFLEAPRTSGLYGFIYPLTYYSHVAIYVFGEEELLRETFDNSITD